MLYPLSYVGILPGYCTPNPPLLSTENLPSLSALTQGPKEGILFLGQFGPKFKDRTEKNMKNNTVRAWRVNA